MRVCWSLLNTKSLRPWTRPLKVPTSALRAYFKESMVLLVTYFEKGDLEKVLMGAELVRNAVATIVTLERSKCSPEPRGSPSTC